MEIAFVDFESVRLANGKALIHNISIVTGCFAQNKGWTSFGRGKIPVYTKQTQCTRGACLDITISNSLKNPAIELSPNIQNKLNLTEQQGQAYGFAQVAVPTLRQAIHIMIDFIFTHTTGIVVSHSFDRDLQFLADTAEMLAEKNVFKRNFVFRPENGCYIPGWDNLTLVCSQRFLTTLCPKFDAMVSAVEPSTKLEAYSRFVYGDDYEQSHTSVKDSIDLFMVMAKAYEYDNYTIDIGKSRMFMKPTMTHGRGQTFSSSTLDLPKN